jgi:ABC-2 type transport system ATP-binding protein
MTTHMATSSASSIGAPALRVSNAAKRFGDTHALADASLVVARGELLGLLGPNGAGKTTMIKAIAGRVALDTGTIEVFGRTLKRDDARPEIGVVPQELAIYKLLTARENLEGFGALNGVEGAALKQRVDWALEWSGLADRSKEPTKRFSGGMQRRLNIACSLIHQPKLVLLDEPTVGVDPQSRERIYEMLAALKAEGVSVVLTTHHLEEAERRCERIVIIDHGKIVAAGTMAELTSQSLGGERLVRIQLGAPLPAGAALPDGCTTDEHRMVVRAAVKDVARDVSARLSQVGALGATVQGVDVTGASLQDVFIALTGRELRE